MSKIPFNRKSTNKTLNANSPLNQGRIDIGLDSIEVKIIDYPDEKRFKTLLSKMVKATVGGKITGETNEEIGMELFRGGLQTGLEAAVVSFEISGVSRAFTHQLVRTRKATFHQQSTRYTDMGDVFNVRMPQSIADNKFSYNLFRKFVAASRDTYKQLCDMDIPFQDARFAVPVGIETYIIAEYPLKVFIDTYAYRACPLFQWEITHVFKLMKAELIKKLPFLEPYIKISCEKTKKCMFQGFESTEDYCDFPWAGDRVYNPDINTIMKK